MGGFAIGARVALLWQHNANPSYKFASIPRYDDIVRTAGCARCCQLAADWRVTGAFSTLLRRPGLRASCDGVLATKNERKMLASTCYVMLVLALCLVNIAGAANVGAQLSTCACVCVCVSVCMQSASARGGSQCVYPCKCPNDPPRCKTSHTIKDGCDCCHICPRQQGDLCDRRDKCDEDRGLQCDFMLDDGHRGICRGLSAVHSAHQSSRSQQSYQVS